MGTTLLSTRTVTASQDRHQEWAATCQILGLDLSMLVAITTQWAVEGKEEGLLSGC